MSTAFCFGNQNSRSYNSTKNNERPDHEGLGRPGSPPPELLAAQSKQEVSI